MKEKKKGGDHNCNIVQTFFQVRPVCERVRTGQHQADIIPNNVDIKKTHWLKSGT